MNGTKDSNILYPPHVHLVASAGKGTPSFSLDHPACPLQLKIFRKPFMIPSLLAKPTAGG